MEKITPVSSDSNRQNRYPDHEIRQWALWCHLSVLAGFIVPLGNLIAPLIIWQIRKDDMPGMDEHGKEVVNYQLSFTLYYFIAGILTIIIVGFFALIALGIVSIVLTIIAAIEVDKGRMYRYPLTIRFIK
ncbi:MAG: DUF4870 domain-containing protein [Cyclobacteriaceae bacterium]